MILTSKFDIEERVIIDGDHSLVSVITCINFRKIDYVDYEISYIHNGDGKVGQFEEFRLQRDTQ